MSDNQLKLQSLIARFKSSALFKDSFWALFGNVMSKGLSLLAAILVARFLGRETYGEYGMIKNTLIYIAVFSTFGLGFTSTKFIAQNKDSNKARLKSLINSAKLVSFAFSSMMAILVFVIADQLANYLEDPALATTLRYTAIIIVFNSITAVQIGVLSGLKKFKETARVSVYVGIITFVFSVALAYLYGLEGAIIALLITNVANCIFNHFVIRKATVGLPNDELLSWADVKEMISFSAPIALQESSYSITFWASNLLLVKMADYGQLGLHSAAGQWTAVILFIPSVLQNVMLSYLSESSVGGSGQHAMLKKMLLINFTATFIPFLLALAASPFLVLMYGESYEGLALVLNIAMATTIIRCLVQVFIQEFIALGKTWTLCGIRLCRDIVSLALSALLIMQLKENAAFLYNLSFMIASAICLMRMWVLYRKYTKHIN